MGSCISKCKSKTETNPHVQDKVVISQAPISSPTRPPATLRKLALCPSTTPTSSFSSFSCPSKSNSSELASSLSSSLSSSCSSTVLSSKVDRSFSNDFLWSCAKDNPQIIGLDVPIKEHKVIHVGKSDSHVKRTKPNVAPVKQSVPEGRLAQKRARASSPTLTRQKSFRVEPERTNSTYSRILKSPSPSRRFNIGDDHNNKGAFAMYSAKESCGSSKRAVSSARKENVRPASPSNRFSRDHSYSRNRETFSHQIGSKVGIREMRSDVLTDILMEDIDNPLIALDCFIFL